MTLSEIARSLNLSGQKNHPGRPGHPGLPPVIFMTDERRLADPSDAIRRLAPGSAVLFRHYGAADRDQIAARLKQICRDRRLRLIISADAGLADKLKADGLHLPEYLVAAPPALALNWRRRTRGLLTAAAHSPRALREALNLGVDAAILSPVFATKSHPLKPPLGVPRFFSISRTANMAIYALGGVTADNALRLRHTTIAGIAGIGGFL